jgi:hypothetical protein
MRVLNGKEPDMTKMKAGKAKARSGVKSLPAKTLGFQEARDVRGGDAKVPIKSTTKTTSTDKYLEVKLEQTIISS